ncbi:MAG: hypothetical protein ABIH64_05730, partial [Nanoarchaeota archaeon]
NPMFNPTVFASETIYTLVILIFCMLVYFKTKEIYDLSKHKGIQFFRYAFLFFGLAYASRIILYVMIFSESISFEPIRRGKTIFMQLLPVSNLVVAYLSTLAILYLIYSTIWKKMDIEHFLIVSNIVALFVAVVAFVSRSPSIISIIQLVLLVVLIIFSTKKKEKDKKKTHARALYILIAIFWLLNLLVLNPVRRLPLQVLLFFQIASIGVFVAIYYKVHKWVK